MVYDLLRYSLNVYIREYKGIIIIELIGSSAKCAKGIYLPKFPSLSPFSYLPLDIYFVSYIIEHFLMDSCIHERAIVLNTIFDGTYTDIKYFMIIVHVLNTKQNVIHIWMIGRVYTLVFCSILNWKRKYHKCRPLRQFKKKWLISSIPSVYQHWGDVFIFISNIFCYSLSSCGLIWIEMTTVLFPVHFWRKYQPILPPVLDTFHSTYAYTWPPYVSWSKKSYTHSVVILDDKCNIPSS